VHLGEGDWHGASLPVAVHQINCGQQDAHGCGAGPKKRRYS
jgi:hypothetical protein